MQIASKIFLPEIVINSNALSNSDESLPSSEINGLSNSMSSFHNSEFAQFSLAFIQFLLP